MASIGIARPAPLGAEELAARSRGELDRALTHDAELTVARAAEDAVLLGAFQRASELGARARDFPLFRRGSGGGAVRVGAGTLWVSLALRAPDALTPCAADKLVNRYVRPILRALTRLGAPAHYFGRDWIAVARRPAGAIGFAHDASTGRAHVEALVALSTPFALDARASFVGKEPLTVSDAAGAPVDPERARDALVGAFTAAYAREPAPVALPAPAAASREAARVEPREPPWAATVDEAIGVLGAGRDASGRFRVGGELLASRDALAALEARAAALGDAARAGAADDALARAVDDAFGAGGVLDGVRSRASLVSVVKSALAIPS